jgi:uncharacterized membrane protein YeiH
MEMWIYWIGMAGTVAFAITAVLAVAPKGIDLFGACVMGIITAVGGGTLRDIILDVPVFWSQDVNYIWVSLIASIITFYATRIFASKYVTKVLLVLDAVGISLFGIGAVDKVWDLGFGLPISPVLLGVLTAIGGGLLRDIIAGRKNLIMSREIYAIAVMLGCTMYVVVILYFPTYRIVGSIAGIVVIFGLRLAVIQKNLIVPGWFYSNAQDDGKNN